MANSGKNKRRSFEVEDKLHNVVLSVDSEEEVQLVQWINEAKDLSVINDFIYQPESYTLFDSVKYTDIDGKSKTLFQKHQYTTDFCITFNPNIQTELAKEFKVQKWQLSSAEVSAYIDVKGMFNQTKRSFTTDRKWVYDKFKVFIIELIPQKFFAKFGCPEEARYSKKQKKPKKCFLGFPSLKDIFKCVN